MQLAPAGFARAIHMHASAGATFRVAFDVELSDRRNAPAFVECHGDGIFRLRIGPATLPDYGLVLSQPHELDARRGADGSLRIEAGTTALSIGQDPLRVTLERDGAVVLRSITDEHFRGWTRFPAFGHDGARWTAAVALESGEPVYGLGEKFSSLNRRGQLLHSQVEDALGVNTELAYKNVPFCWSPRGLGAVRQHAGARVPRCRLSRMVASVVRGDRRRRSARPVPARRRLARADAVALYAGDRPRTDAARVGPGVVGVESVLRDGRRGDRRRGSAACA